MSRECILIGAVEHMSVECSSRGSEVLRAGSNRNLLDVSWARSAACDTSRLAVRSKGTAVEPKVLSVFA